MIVPFEVVGVAESDETMLLELLHIPELFVVDDVIDVPMLLTLRATRLLALAVIRLLRSSRSSDFSGDTWRWAQQKAISVCEHRPDWHRARSERSENENKIQEREH